MKVYSLNFHRRKVRVLVIGAAEHGGMAAAVIVLVEIKVNLLKLIAFIEIA